MEFQIELLGKLKKSPGTLPKGIRKKLVQSQKEIPAESQKDIQLYNDRIPEGILEVAPKEILERSIEKS